MAVRACLGAGSLGRARAAAFRAGVLPVDADGFGAAVDGLHKAEHQADANIAALARRIWVGAAPAAKAAEEAVENVPQVDVASEGASAACAAAKVGVHPGMAELVVPGPFIFIREHLVRLVDFLKLCLRLFIPRVEVRVVLFRQFAVGFFNFVFGGVLRHTHHFIKIPFIGHTTFSP